jgi:hypothetical protein
MKKAKIKLKKSANFILKSFLGERVWTGALIDGKYMIPFPGFDLVFDDAKDIEVKEDKS